MDAEEIEIPSMLIPPFVENAVLHGLSEKEAGSRLQISFSLKNKLLYSKIVDNGIGRDSSGTIAMKNRNTHHTSSAIDITKKRLNTLKKKVNYKPIIIADLYDAEDQPSGTKVQLMVPYQTNF
ncbi:MAG: sensor histidine kinase YesM [Saprospiraceae bacterium]|jgi:sensor histidine kinase YesM